MEEGSKNKEFKKDKQFMSSYAQYGGMAFQMIAIIGIFAFAGYKIDHSRSAKTPIFTAVLSLLGVCISLYIIIRSIKNIKP